MEVNRIINADILDAFKQVDDNSVDLICSSPPYNLSVNYDSWNDKMLFDDYFNWCKQWLAECQRVLKPDGRFAINIPFEVGNQHDPKYDNKIFIVAEYHRLLKELGLHYMTTVRLTEEHPQFAKATAWGSWLNASAPYITNHEECVLIGYKTQWKKLKPGTSTMTKEKFMEAVSGMWKYRAETRGLTEANFGLALPLTAIEILSFKEDLVLDCFSGSATTALAAWMTGRNYLGFEISEKYWKIGNNRLMDAKDRTLCSLKELFE